MDRLCVWLLLLFLARTQSERNTGYVLTLPNTLQAGANETFCLTLHGIENDIEFTLSLKHENTEKQYEHTYTFRQGQSRCQTFPVPRSPGYYDVVLKNSTDVMTSSRDVKVESGNLITFIQTDKPIYKPGEAVKFRILTVKRDLKSRKGKIDEIIIYTPNTIRVKQWHGVLSDGLSSFTYPMPAEPKLGTWTIEVVIDEEKIKQTFKVEKYVLPKFDVTITPPSFILGPEDVIKGKVCAHYTYGKPVTGFLILDICFVNVLKIIKFPSSRQTFQINGCHSFSLKVSDITAQIARKDLTGSELHIEATVRERDTGLEVKKINFGPKVAYYPVKLKIQDTSEGYYKRMSPYQGWVLVTKPDGSPAPGELIEIAINDYISDIHIARNFTTDKSGKAMFAVCNGLDKTLERFEVEAKAPLYRNSKYNMPVTMKTIIPWYSPSNSYIMIPQLSGDLRCGEQKNITIAYSTQLNTSTTFYYQIISRGRIQYSSHKTQEFSVEQDSSEIFNIPDSQCLLPIEAESSTRYSPPHPEPRHPIPQEKNQKMFAKEFVATPEIDPESWVIEEEMTSEETVKESETVLPPVQKSSHLAFVTITVPLTTEMSPKASLLVYYVREDGETVADSRDFELQPCFDNKVKMEFQDKTVLPGGDVTLNVEATPGSTCSIGIVDKSVNLAGGDHQLTPEKVFKKLAEFNLPPGFSGYIYDGEYCKNKIKQEEDQKKDKESEKAEEPFGLWHYGSRYKDAVQAFRQTGLIVFTNLTLETRPCTKEYPIYYDVYLSGQVPGEPIRPMEVMAQTFDKPAADSFIRSYFPETWLWDLESIGENGKLSLPLKAPHTVTKWVGNVVCISNTAGLGLSPLSYLTTFQPLFLQLALPYAAVRGERIPIMVTVYNYLKKCLNIQIKLHMSRELSLIIRKSQKLPFCLCAGKTRSQKYYINPKDIGTFPVTATAEIVPGICGNSIDMDKAYLMWKDSVKREIFVKAEGITKEYTKSLYMCPEDGPLVENVELPLPNDTVLDSARGHLSVIGDIMGAALTNLDSLIHLPTGCGEQTMVSFTPNIYILKYLTKTNQLTSEIENVTKHYLEIGYNRELNYQHRDGSFSAFGEKDVSGSTWLTAFVVKSFAQAREYIYVDQMDLEKSIQFLKGTKMENGCFHEVGRVISWYMMGGLGRTQEYVEDTALTAFVLVSLLEANVPRNDPVVKGAFECINRQTFDDMDNYTLAILAYANVLSDPSGHNSHKAMRELQSRIKTKDTPQHWGHSGTKISTSAEVETTAYGLLATLLYYSSEAVSKGQPIAMWLSQQRNSFGGFASTQDTVVGLNALSEFASLSYVGMIDLKIRVDDGRTSKKFKVTSGVNTLVLQYKPMPILPKAIKIRAEGSGCALVQANVRYNQIPENIKTEDPSFYLSLEVRRAKSNLNDCAKRLLKICVGFKGRGDLSSGMSMITVKMVTGWTPTEPSLEELESVHVMLGMKRSEYDQKEAKLSFYFDELDSRSRCFDFEVEQDHELAVSDPKPAEIHVFQYYETDVAVIKSYKLKTTCGTKAEIPLHSEMRIQPDKISPAQKLIDPIPPFLKPQTLKGCPTCLTVRPDLFKDIICKSDGVYKAILGRNGKQSIKIKVNLRTRRKQKVNMQVNFVIAENCDCSVINQTGYKKRRRAKRVLLVTKNVPLIKSAKFPLDGRSFIISIDKNKILEREARKQSRRCKHKFT